MAPVAGNYESAIQSNAQFGFKELYTSLASSFERDRGAIPLELNLADTGPLNEHLLQRIRLARENPLTADRVRIHLSESGGTFNITIRKTLEGRSIQMTYEVIVSEVQAATQICNIQVLVDGFAATQMCLEDGRYWGNATGEITSAADVLTTMDILLAVPEDERSGVALATRISPEDEVIALVQEEAPVVQISMILNAALINAGLDSGLELGKLLLDMPDPRVVEFLEEIGFHVYIDWRSQIQEAFAGNQVFRAFIGFGRFAHHRLYDFMEEFNPEIALQLARIKPNPNDKLLYRLEDPDGETMLLTSEQVLMIGKIHAVYTLIQDFLAQPRILLPAQGIKDTPLLP